MTCKGKNCNSNGKTPHSSECRFEYAANVASGVKGFTMPSRTTDHIATLEAMIAEGSVYAGSQVEVAIRAAIALMRGQSWQSVDDGFPPKHQWVLIYHDGFSVGRYWPCEKGVHDDNEWNWEVVGSDWVDNVTHWQPLPAPPKDTADEQ